MFQDRSRGHLWVSRLEPDLECILRGSLYPHHPHEMPSFSTLRKVRGLSKFILPVIYLILLCCPVSAFPTEPSTPKPPRVYIMENNSTVIVRTKNCQPVPPDVLRARLGIFFDESKMRMSLDEGRDNEKRYSQQSVIDEYDVDEDDVFDDADDNLHDISDSERDLDSVSVHKNYMRRKRTVGDDVDSDSDISNDRKYLYQNLLYDTIFKRKSRQKRSSHSKKFHPAWECAFKGKWRPTKNGYFPTFVYSGSCPQTSCFFGQYRCNKKKYAIKLLKRDPSDLCNPLPLEGNTTTYEERWQVETTHITVACECGLKPKKSRSKGDRKNKRNRERGRNE